MESYSLIFSYILGFSLFVAFHGCSVFSRRLAAPPFTSGKKIYQESTTATTLSETLPTGGVEILHTNCSWVVIFLRRPDDGKAVFRRSKILTIQDTC